MRPELVVLDFDGTFTRVDDEAVPFLEAYQAGLEALLNVPIAPEWERARAIIQADPDRYGWQHDGRIVAPSHADPYILATTIAQLLLQEHHGSVAQGATESLFRQAYATAGTVFRHDARNVVEHVLGLGVPVFVVTNSHTVDVQRKLDRLGIDRDRLEVRGDARKWMIREPEVPDPRFDAIPAELHVEGLGRPMYLRRGSYFDVLSELWKRTGTSPEGTFVCGDIYELDLALPAALGARVHMVGRPSTPAYEREAVRAAGGTFSTELIGALAALG
jgi:phosphoglycolate phosphatase-like HAD superfamily hydrolase